MSAYTPGQKVTINNTQVIYIGQDDDGNDFFYREINCVEYSLGTHHNGTSSEDQYTVTVTEGSSTGYLVSIGAEITAEASLPFAVKGSVTLSGEISYEQGFSKSTSREITVPVQPGETVGVSEAFINVEYFMLWTFPTTNIQLFNSVGGDIINTGSTGSYVVPPEELKKPLTIKRAA